MAATPFTACEPTIARLAMLTLFSGSSSIIDSTLMRSVSPGYFSATAWGREGGREGEEGGRREGGREGGGEGSEGEEGEGGERLERAKVKISNCRDEKKRNALLSSAWH